MTKNVLCKNCGENSALCRAHDDTHSSDSYFQGFSVICSQCGYEDSKHYLFSGDAQQGHVIFHHCPYCGGLWNEHSI